MVTGLVRIGESGTCTLPLPSNGHTPIPKGPTLLSHGYSYRRYVHRDGVGTYMVRLDLCVPVVQVFSVEGDDYLGYEYAIA